MSEPLRVFVSYARNDDRPPVDGEGRGFASTLVKYLENRLIELGRPPEIEFWRDTRAILPSDQFDGEIEKGLTSADALLVVLSQNWLSSEYCKRELEFFGQRFGGDHARAKRHVIVAVKRFVPDEMRPASIKGQEGYKFFRPDKDSPGGFYEFFAFGKTCLPEFQIVAEALSYDLWGRACTKGNVAMPVVATPMRSTPGRTIFVARPAPDMRAAFDRVEQELRHRDYEVVPDVTRDVPLDATAASFFDDALRNAEAAIHLLGEKQGFIPDETLAPIATLQLQRSRERVLADSRFQRLIWAPSSYEGTAQRDPLDVLRRFGDKTDNDRVDGSDLSAFVDFVVEHLKESLPAVPQEQALPADARVYVYHQRGDEAYAMALARALRERKLGTVFPIFEGDPAKLRAWHEKQLRSCDAVLLCWANADEAFTFSTIDEFSDWHALGRTTNFASRAVAVGPPRSERKESLIEFPPRPEVDIVIDLTRVDNPGPEELAPLLSATSGA